MKNSPSRLLIYICIIIVTAFIFIRPQSAHAICPGTSAKVQSIIKNVLLGHPEQLGKVVNIILDLTTSCDDSGNPTGNPGNGTPIPYPTYDPGSITNDEVLYSNQFMQIIQSFCGSRIVSTSNISCLNSLSSIMTNEAVNKFKIFQYIPTTYIQCVTCAVGMAYARGKPYTFGGNAKDHANRYVPNYRYYSNIKSNRTSLKPGSLFISTSGTWGHIGYVIKVFLDSNNEVDSFQGFECNWGSPGLVRNDRVININSIAGWQTPL